MVVHSWLIFLVIGLIITSFCFVLLMVKIWSVPKQQALMYLEYKQANTSQRFVFYKPIEKVGKTSYNE